MTFLLDTNVVSEWIKPRPNREVVTWLADVDEDRLFLSVITLAQLRSGVAAMSPSRRRDQLDTWISVDLPDRFEGRLLSIDPEVADRWGRITGSARMAGRPIHAMDSFLAATAIVHDLTIVTRNVSDFASSGVQIFCPWRSLH